MVNKIKAATKLFILSIEWDVARVYVNVLTETTVWMFTAS